MSKDETNKIKILRPHGRGQEAGEKVFFWKNSDIALKHCFVNQQTGKILRKKQLSEKFSFVYEKML